MKFSGRAERSLRLVVAMVLIGSAAGMSPAEAGTTITIGSGFNSPNSVAVGASGNVFVADTYNFAVKEILAPGYTTVNSLGGFYLPSAVAVDASGNVWVLDFQLGLKEIVAPGYTTVNPMTGWGFQQAKGVAVDASGNVFVADTLNHRVVEILAAGGYTTGNTIGSGFSSPYGVAVDASGNVFVVDWLNSNVKEILKVGGYTTVNTLASVNNCTGIAVDASSNVYVACPFGVAEILAPDYTTINYIGSGFDQPTGVAVDASGNVFVADSRNSAIKEITAALAPSITKSFGASTILQNSTTSLTFTITNPNAVTSLKGVAFTDNLPGGLVVATPNGLTNTCGATATAVAGASSASLSGATLAAGASCTVAVDVFPTSLGVKNNSVQATSTNGGVGNTSNATLTVSGGAPAITKVFGAETAKPGFSVSLTFTISNPNADASLTDIAFTDNLPEGLLVHFLPQLTNTCGGTATAIVQASSVSLSGATLAASASCTVVVNVYGATLGVKNNSVQVTSNGGVGNVSNASLTVSWLPPKITKVFGATTISPNGTTSLTFTVTNPNATTLTGVAFTDSLPAGLVVATPPGLTSDCFGTETADAGASSVSLSGGTVPTLASCTTTVSVTGTTVGVKNNSVQVSSTNGGIGNTSNAALTVSPPLPPTITKAFGAAAIELNGTTSLTFTINNPNASRSLTGVAFADSLPAGLLVATPNGLTNTCGGTATAVAGAASASLSGATLAAGASCTMAVGVQGTTLGVKNNNVQVNSTNGGTGNTSNASLTVSTLAPAITKVFGAATISLNGTTPLTFTVTNPNAAASLTGVAFTDSLPAGLLVATPNGLTSTCGGTTSAVAGASSASLSGATLAAGASCTMAVGVQGTTLGVKNNNVQVNSANGGTGNTSNASLTVSTLAPSITKAFGAAAIELNGTTSLTFTINNPNAFASLTGVAFTDSLPAGLLVATPNGLTSSCGGTATAVAGASSASLSGATLAASASCTMAVSVNGATVGLKNNSVQVNSTNGGVGNTANALLTVSPPVPPTITKAFGEGTIPLDSITSLTFTLTNPNTFSSLTGVAFTDSLPAGLVVATPNGLTNTCSGTATADAGAASASLSGATLAGGAVCSMSVYVQATTLGLKYNSVQATSANGGTGTMSIATLKISTCASSETLYCDGFEAATVLTLGSGFNQSVGLAADASGNVFVADTGNYKVKEILAADGYTTINTLGSGFNQPVAVAVDSSGNVFVVDSGSTVKEILAAGGYTTVNTLATGFNDTRGIADDSSGNLFVADRGNNAVKEILAAGGYTTIITIGSGFYFPTGVAVDASGNVFVADKNNNAVKEILAPGYTTVNTLGSGFTLPYGVAIAANGNVFVADFYNSAVKEILKAGGYTTVNTLGSGFDHPTGIAVDASGNVFVSDGSSKVKVILAPNGHP
jgi:uncharacterized repeat protein (TIGR01451 family)